MKRHSHRGHHEHREKRDFAKMAISLDHNYAMAEFIGDLKGITSEELEALAPDMAQVDQQLKAWRSQGSTGFFDLPYDDTTVQEIKGLAKQLKEWHHDLLVLGIGGSVLGARALHQALRPPAHNLFSLGERHYHTRFFVADTIEPDSFYGLLHGLELQRTCVNVISKSGETPETTAQFLFVYNLLKGRLGADKMRSRFIVTTDPEQGHLCRLAKQEGLHILSVPPNVTGRFAVFSPVGLFPAAMVGIDIEDLLAGARCMDQRLQETPLADNLAYRLAALYFLAFRRKGCDIQVFMPYAASLAGIADWICQLWAESLGKKNAVDGSPASAGPTPVRAVGTTDQHSQLQLYLEGPANKLITFLEVEKFQHAMTIPSCGVEEMNYLEGRSLAELLAVEKQATALQLMKHGRPSLTLKLPEINPFTIGQVLYLLQVTVAALGVLLNINPLDQPGVESGKQATYGLLGRPGYEAWGQEIADTPLPLGKYMI
ncbi:MAG: glucose-6-phosphate isomerase [Deltaproteobacteria bacterium]|nr:glucose-6-phosphate isomerase [Deltaproteobacteria bacterium]